MGGRATWRVGTALLCLAAATVLVAATAADTASTSLRGAGSVARSELLIAVRAAKERLMDASATDALPPAGVGITYIEPKAGVLRGTRMLVLSAGSLAYDGNHPGNASISTPDACRAACAALPGCGGWTFCNDGVKGCGTGCKAYTKEHPKLKVNGPYDVTASLPITAFGPWTYPRNSEDGCHPISYDGATSDAWPFGLCTLLDTSGGAFGASEATSEEPPYNAEAEAADFSTKAADVSTKASSSRSTFGWVSSKILLPASASCNGLSAQVCGACLGTANPEKCVECARDRRAKLASGSAYVTKRAIGNDFTRGCALCANVTSDDVQSTCFDCVLSAKPCATCALGSSMLGTGAPDVGACLSCVARRGQAFAGECNECAQSGAPSRCFSCLDSYDLKICPAAPAALRALPLGSCRAKGSETPCARCANNAKSGELFDQCLKCHSDPGRDQECGGCATAPEDAGGQARCFSCVARAGFKSYREYGCSQCFGAWVAPERREECLGCVEAAATPGAAKRFCGICSDGGEGRESPKELKACYGCLQAQGTHDYSMQCLNGDGARRRRRRASSLRRLRF